MCRVPLFFFYHGTPKKTHGVGATVSCLIKFLHPSELIRNKFPNPVNGQRLDGCITVCQELKKINRKDQLSLIVRHANFVKADGDPILLHGVKKHFKIDMEGDPDLFFDAVTTSEETEVATASVVPLPQAIDEEVSGQNDGGANDLLNALNGVVDINDDNEPAPENIPSPQDNASQHNSILSGDWGHDGICFRRQLNVLNQKARLHFDMDVDSGSDINLQLFEGLFPTEYLQHVVLVETNKKLEESLTYGELLRWIGVWVLMSTVDGSDRRSFWAAREIDIYYGAPFRLTNIMSRTRFEAILSAITYTNHNPPAFVDRFWEVRQLVDCWNENMNKNFSPSWINAIDESMSKWVNKYTCPGFMYVPRKPWKFGNEYHDAGCADSDIIWQVDLREGKDRPRELGQKEYDEKGKTTGTLL